MPDRRLQHRRSARPGVYGQPCYHRLETSGRTGRCLNTVTSTAFIPALRIPANACLKQTGKERWIVSSLKMARRLPLWPRTVRKPITPGELAIARIFDMRTGAAAVDLPMPSLKQAARRYPRCALSADRGVQNELKKEVVRNMKQCKLCSNDSRTRVLCLARQRPAIHRTGSKLRRKRYPNLTCCENAMFTFTWLTKEAEAFRRRSKKAFPAAYSALHKQPFEPQMPTARHYAAAAAAHRHTIRSPQSPWPSNGTGVKQYDEASPQIDESVGVKRTISRSFARSTKRRLRHDIRRGG